MKLTTYSHVQRTPIVRKDPALTLLLLAPSLTHDRIELLSVCRGCPVLDYLVFLLIVYLLELVEWQVQGEGPLAKAIPNHEKAVKRVNGDTFAVMKLFRNGTTKCALRTREELILHQPKLYKTQLPLRLYGSASCGRRVHAEPSNTRSSDDRCHRARVGSLADDRRATVS